MSTSTCLFDLGDVLIRFSHARMCEQIGRLCDRTGDETRTLLIESGLQWEFERGRLDEERFRDRLQEATGREIDLDALRLASADIFEPQPGVDEVVAALSAAATRLVLLSNTCVTHFEFVRERYPLLGRFDDFVLSYEVGSVKPEPAIYEEALRRIDCAPGDCFYTDDRPENVEAARPYGLDAELFTDVPTLSEQLAARGLPTAGR